MSSDDGILICHCVGVRLGEIRAAIRAGARSVEDLQRQTGACTGCQSCYGDCREIIKETVAAEGLKAEKS